LNTFGAKSAMAMAIVAIMATYVAPPLSAPAETSASRRSLKLLAGRGKIEA